MLPWWSHPKLTIRFFRPLTSAMVWVEHTLLGDRPEILHVHSFAWWIATVLAARAFLRRRLRARAASIAWVIFALAPCHALPIAWLANREALVSITFGTLALTAHAAWREEGDARWAIVAAGLFALALTSGEYTLCFGGYVLAVELVARGRSLPKRVVGLLPFALPAVVYLGVRASLHYGTFGSGFYNDPTAEPLSFLATAPRRLSTLLIDEWYTLDTETLADAPPWKLVVLFFPSVALFWVPLKRVYASLEAREKREAEWLALGSLFALAPVLAVVPSPRVCGASMLGVSAWVALLLDHVWFAPPHARRGAAEVTGFVATLLGFFHLVHGPATSWLVGRAYNRSSVEFATNAKDLRERLPPVKEMDVVVLRGMGGSFFMPFGIDPLEEPPMRWRILAQTGHVLVLRKDARSIEVVSSGSLFPLGHGNLYRSEDLPMQVGDEFRLSGVKVTVTEIGERGARAARFDFERDLDAVSFLTERVNKGYPEARIPTVGMGAPFDP